MENHAVNVRINLRRGFDNLRHGLRRSFGWMCVAVFTIAVLATVTANGQLTGKGAITGIVTDKTGAVVPDASITARNDATGISTTTKTTGAGDYTFSNLDPGIYTVVTTAKGFEKLVQQNVHVDAMESQSYSPVLTVGGSSVEITVTAEPPQLETSNATLGATMEQDTYAELPIEMGAYGNADQRRATDFVYLMPGVQGNETNGNATTNVGVVNGSGSRGAASAVYVDGVVFVRAGGNGDPRYVWTAISVDAIDQFQVQTNGYSAIYEGQGIMNYTVKQGGDTQHGSVYEFFRNTELDTWGFLGKVPNPATGLPVKPVEHSNEYGINLGGPLVPFGSWKNKLFYYANYNGFRYSSATPTSMTFPTAAEQGGNFQAANVPIYDPTTQATCTANSTNGPCRYRYGFPFSGTKGSAGGPVTTAPDPTKVDVIPSTEWSPQAVAMQSFLPTTGVGTALGGNYISPNSTGLVNWSTTDRIDYHINSNDTLTLIAALGRQASSNPVGQTTAGRNVGPVPYNYGQTYAPKTAVGIIEETHVFTDHLINQVKWGYARYFGPTFNPNQAAAYSANTVVGISGLPAGQAQQTFPIVAFGSGTAAPTQWGGTTANVTTAENYTALDNLQWTVGKHSLTFGGQLAWMLYNTTSATGGTTPITLTAAASETESFKTSSNTAPKYTLNSGGQAYASYLLGDFDKGTLTDYSLHPTYGARFRAISPYVQDNWKVSTKLTLDLGLRWDYFPSVKEVNNDGGFFDPLLPNPASGLAGGLNFTGYGPGTCNCATPANGTFLKNLGPRLGAAYQIDSKTVIRGSYGVMFTHGDAVGGLASTLGTLGFAASPSFSSSNSSTTMPGLLATTALIAGSGTGAVPTYTGASGRASGASYGTGYTTTTGFTGSPTGMNYDDPYLATRAPEYINWSLSLQRQITNTLALSVAYVGSEGHFLQTDSLTGRGYYADALDPKYLVTLGSHLADTGATIATDCTTYSLTCPAKFLTTQPLSTALKPFPFQSVSDSFGYIGNANYNGLQASASMRAWKGLTFNANYTWSRAIDDGGTFRSGYAIPAGALANQSTVSFAADHIERSVSTSNQPQHFVLTAVWDWPFGKTLLADNTLERAILGGFKFSSIYQAFSGSPLAITASVCQTNPASAQSSSSCAETMNPNFTGKVRQNGKWGKGVSTDPTSPNYYSTYSFITPSIGGVVNGGSTTETGPFVSPVANIPGVTVGSAVGNQATLLNTAAAPSYTFGDSPRTAPYNLYGPGNYQLDLAMVRSFPLHITKTSALNFRAEWYNVTNHTQFALLSTVLGNSSFGAVTTSSAYNRKIAQFSARIEF